MLHNASRRQLIFSVLYLLLFTAITVFVQAQPFPVLGPEGKAILVNTEGEVICETEYSMVEAYSHGFAVANIGDGYRFIDTTGNRAFDRDFDDARSFSEGLAAVCVDNKWGYINTAGKVVIKQHYGQAYDFSEGLACVLQGHPGEETALYGYIDTHGNFAIKPFLKHYDHQYFTVPGKFVEGLAPAWLSKGESGELAVGFINKSGEIAIQPEFGGAGHFGNGLAPVSLDIESMTGQWGYIDPQGKPVIKSQFDMAHSFSEGLAPAYATPEGEEAENSNNGGYINTSGEWAIPAMYQVVEPFKNGYARVYIDENNEGFIRKDGSLVASTRMLQSKMGINPVVVFRPKKVTASSFLSPSKSGKPDYKPENAVDTDISSAWIEKAKGPGIGEWIKFEFGQAIQLDSMNIWPGYQKTADGKRDPFTTNLRPARIRISYKNGNMETQLEDRRGSQTIPANAIKTDFIKIEILSVHQTAKEDQDCGFSEIEFKGKTDL